MFNPIIYIALYTNSFHPEHGLYAIEIEAYNKIQAKHIFRNNFDSQYSLEEVITSEEYIKRQAEECSEAMMKVVREQLGI